MRKQPWNWSPEFRLRRTDPAAIIAPVPKTVAEAEFRLRRLLIPNNKRAEEFAQDLHKVRSADDFLFPFPLLFHFSFPSRDSM